MTIRDAKIVLLLTWPLLCVAGIYLVDAYRTPPNVVTRADQPPSQAKPPPPEPVRLEPMPITALLSLEEPPLPVERAPLVVPPLLAPVVKAAPPAEHALAKPKPARSQPIVVIRREAAKQRPMPVAAPIPSAKPSEPLQVVVALEPLPSMRPAFQPESAPQLPLTGKFSARLDEHGGLTLPASLRKQLGVDDTILAAPGTAACLWLTTPAHVQMLTDRLERLGDVDVAAFRRLFFSQAEKLNVDDEGRVALAGRLAQFAGLDREVVVIGADDHVEVWDAARWRRVHEREASAEDEK